MVEPNKAMVICPKCGHSNISVAKFCAKCSTPLKQQDHAQLSVADRIKELQGYADEMLVNLKTFAFQELEIAITTSININQVYLTVSELRKIVNSNSKEKYNSDILDKQSEFVKQFDSCTLSKLPSILSEYETNKIETKVHDSKVNWLTLSQKYDDLCGQLKSLGKFNEEADFIDFSKLFNGPLDSVCGDPRTSGRKIIDTVGVEIPAVNSNSIKQIKFLQKFKDHLMVIGYRTA